MIDLTPNDLSHLSDEEFNALCPQGEHAPGPEPLSPAAQAISDAYENTRSYSETGLIAAIRELKDQVAPHRPIPLNPLEWGEYNMTEIIRERLDAIATELEQLNDPA